MSFWAVKQLYELLGDYRFKRIVKQSPGEESIHEFEHGTDPNRVLWVAWSPTGTRTNEKDNYVPREAKVTLSGLPSLPVRVVGMATAEGEDPQPSWERTGPAAITLTLGESPTYLILEHAAPRN